MMPNPKPQANWKWTSIPSC